MLEDRHIKYLESRGIDAETASSAGVYSTEKAIVFPTFENGLIVNEKFRDGNKNFWQSPDGKQMFYNPSGLDLAIEEDKPLVIVEGEMDCLSLLQCKYAWTVSVPCGAPAKEVEFYSIEEDNKFKFLWNDKRKLDAVKTFILAADNDAAGKVLNHELVKRLGVERCKFVSYPDGCKDFNDVLRFHGEGEVHKLINTARHYPVVGLYKPDEFPPMPEKFKVPYKTHLGYEHDKHLKIQLGKLMVVTGYPTHGKSEWTDNLVLKMAQKHDWKVCVCSPEIDNQEYEENTIQRILRRELTKENGEYKFIGANEYDKAFEFYREHYTFITNQTLNDDLELNLDKLLELAEIAVLRDGCKILLVDPFNEIEHCRDKGESETDYIGRAIRKFKKFARQFGILVIIVAHPIKPPQGKIEPPTLYSISGSAHWANKADYGIILWRPDNSDTRAQVLIRKIKRNGPMGWTGDIDVDYDAKLKQFLEI